MNRRDLLALATGAVALGPIATHAQQKPLPVIGWLAVAAPDRSAPLLAAFLQGLRETGYVDGQNVGIEYRWAGGHYDRPPALAADLVARHIDVFVAGGGTPSALAAKDATREIPIVFVTGDDPVEKRLVASLARPGGNLTGVSVLASDLVPKQIELLAELVPQGRMVALLANPTSPLAARLAREAQEGHENKGMQLHLLKAGTEAEIEAAFAALHQLKPDALLVGPDPFFISRRDKLVTLISRHAVPAIYLWRIFADAGGLVSYGPSLVDALRRVGNYAGRLLRWRQAGRPPGRAANEWIGADERFHPAQRCASLAG